jgi:lysozyme family protein
MADFRTSYKITAKIEGGYANNPKDTGGETWRGIARKKNPGFIGWSIIDRLRKQRCFPNSLNASFELEQQVLNFYKENYWDVFNLDYMEGKL